MDGEIVNIPSVIETIESVISINNESDPEYLTQDSLKLELIKNKKLISFYEECEHHNEVIGFLNSNIQFILKRSKAIKTKEQNIKIDIISLVC
jgi:hypothetical protein